MFATVAMEGTDTFDAVSRAYSYIFGRPWRLIWYSLVAAAYGLVVTAFVLIFTSAMIAAPIYIGGWAMGANFDQIRAFLWNPAWQFPVEAGWGVKKTRGGTGNLPSTGGRLARRPLPVYHQETTHCKPSPSFPVGHETCY